MGDRGLPNKDISKDIQARAEGRGRHISKSHFLFGDTRLVA